MGGGGRANHQDVATPSSRVSFGLPSRKIEGDSARRVRCSLRSKRFRASSNLVPGRFVTYMNNVVLVEYCIEYCSFQLNNKLVLGFQENQSCLHITLKNY